MKRDIRTVAESDIIPRSLGIMPDGNRRWAARNGVSTEQGYRNGAAHLMGFYSWCDDLDITSVTAWLLTERNAQRRPSEQLTSLLDVCVEHAWDVAKEQRRRLKVVGNMTLLPPRIADSLAEAMDTTTGVDGAELILGVASGGRSEIVNAVLACRNAVSDGEITEDAVTACLNQRHQPELDLIIRSSGEQRLSDMGVWQAAWAEMYFSQQLWQDFTRADFDDAIAWYSRRLRRHGK